MTNSAIGAEMLWDSGSLKVVDQKFLIANPWAYDEVLPLILNHLYDLSGYYPGFNEWLNQKVVPGLIKGERAILLEHSRGRLSGLAIVKDDSEEQKLCCLRVLPEFQGTGVGLKLFERSFDTLNNSAPLLSIAEEQNYIFEKIFKYYGFELAKKYHNYYRPRKDELSFNGLIDTQTIFRHTNDSPRKLISNA
ncbi:GNAT family N-acetyltransferase [Pseudomonas syringae]|uniref:GNAT family N-acetyltransferase n=1 Tax=Pseudomonas syringae TaxID=317 RepID=UPI001BCD49D9|nr:GNAT family N-acetyltransferase [Pseudomonas syringae]MBS7435858.1 GNAT family N-acetyltransferase [Pseudomonas syringae]MBS7460647.1 GNAT family N-acetyltransferase [Pseudomonas syringae]